MVLQVAGAQTLNFLLLLLLLLKSMLLWLLLLHRGQTWCTTCNNKNLGAYHVWLLVVLPSGYKTIIFTVGGLVPTLYSKQEAFANQKKLGTSFFIFRTDAPMRWLSDPTSCSYIFEIFLADLLSWWPRSKRSARKCCWLEFVRHMRIENHHNFLPLLCNLWGAATTDDKGHEIKVIDPDDLTFNLEWC